MDGRPIWLLDYMDMFSNTIAKSNNPIRSAKKRSHFHTTYDVLKADKLPCEIDLDDIKERIDSHLNSD